MTVNSRPAASGLLSFATNPAFTAYLDRCWREKEGWYWEPSFPAPSQHSRHLALYHIYLSRLGLGHEHWTRAEKLVRLLAAGVWEDGTVTELNGQRTDHPAAACHLADVLGTFCHYARGGEVRQAAKTALLRIVEQHPAVRRPGGIAGRTQQMRFELPTYYWAWRVTGDESYREACLTLWENGIHYYQHPLAYHGSLSQPSLHPDFTWNYTCGAGTTTEYATNTHTPTYYGTEPQGFFFVYLHGLKEGVFQENPVWSDFCRRYILGLRRNLSRAGHTTPDLDGYGIHRVWFSGCLLETAPFEAAAAAARVGAGNAMQAELRWYIDRYIDFIKRSNGFSATGLPEECPYGHRIGIEQGNFSALSGARFYAYLARALFEYDLDALAPAAPAASADYAWWHNWVRVSTPGYETSFVGTTSLRNLPQTRHFGDPNLGTIHGGSPLSTLFAGDRLLYATSNTPEGLWRVEAADYNGNVFRSIATSFADETSQSFRAADGRIFFPEDFADYGDPFGVSLEEGEAEVLWSKRLRIPGLRFFVRNAYGKNGMSARWGVRFPLGFYVQTAAFVLPVPASMRPQIRMAHSWIDLTDGLAGEAWPEALRWHDGQAGVEVNLAADEATRPARHEATIIPPLAGSPGGVSSFCPFPLVQLRLTAAISPQDVAIVLNSTFRFLKGRNESYP
jgi:hypothetical protein